MISAARETTGKRETQNDARWSGANRSRAKEQQPNGSGSSKKEKDTKEKQQKWEEERTSILMFRAALGIETERSAFKPDTTAHSGQRLSKTRGRPFCFGHELQE